MQNTDRTIDYFYRQFFIKTNSEIHKRREYRLNFEKNLKNKKINRQDNQRSNLIAII